MEWLYSHPCQSCTQCKYTCQHHTALSCGSHATSTGQTCRCLTNWPFCLSVKLNPGPTKWPRFPRVICTKACKANKKAQACDRCDHRTYESSVNVTTESYNRLGDSDEQWTYSKCHSNNISAKLYTILPDTGNSSHLYSQNISVQQKALHPLRHLLARPLNNNIQATIFIWSQQSQPPNWLWNQHTSSPNAQMISTESRKDKQRNLCILNSNCQSIKKKDRAPEPLIESIEIPQTQT